MIYNHHLDFKNEISLQREAKENVRGIIPIVENTQFDFSSLLPVVSSWLPASGLEIAGKPTMTDYFIKRCMR
ncbi:MAG: hypothetical protein Q9M39_09625 [Sulfurovum sp.]|nr:hypothetical protein [Sulfurovum sp.]